MDQWKAAGKKIYIYSSGSVPAQKLLVGYSTKGDLMSVSLFLYKRHTLNINFFFFLKKKYFSGYFDTSVGLKTESASYENIAQQIGKENNTESILFVTDNINGSLIALNIYLSTKSNIFCNLEIFAATKAGYQVVISDRPGNAPLGPESKEFKIVTSFDQI